MSLLILVMVLAILQLFITTALLILIIIEFCQYISSFFPSNFGGCRRRIKKRAKSFTFKYFLHVPYLRSIINWFVSISSIVLVIVWIVRRGRVANRSEWQAAVVISFLNWSHFILLCDKLPVIGIYVVMFTRILSTFLKVSIFGLLLILAFSVILMALFQDPLIMVSIYLEYLQTMSI